MATGWKRLVEIGLSRGGPARVAMRRRPAIAILAYHNIVPTGEHPAGDRSLHVDQAVFAEQLDSLREWADVVSLSKIHQQPTNSRPRVVITFDDAYRGTMTAGMAELEKRGMPATVFVPTGLIGGSGFWWDRIVDGDLPLSDSDRAFVLDRLQGDGVRAAVWTEEQGRSLVDLPDHAQPVTEEELAGMTVPGLTLGAHTVSHRKLPGLDADALRQEFGESKEWLRARVPHYVDWLAYPYGLHDDVVVQVAREFYEGALLVNGGALRGGGAARSDPHRTPRINVSRGVTLDGLRCRVAGLIR